MDTLSTLQLTSLLNLPDNEAGRMVSPDNEMTGEPWYALWVRSRHEKSVTEILQNKGVETFLPLCKSRRRWSDRIRDLELPLIPGYVFCRFDRKHRIPILATPGVVQIVGAGKTPEPVDEIEMESLISAARSGLHLQLWPFLKAGQRVLIEEGPLRSLEGILVTTKGKDQLIISVTLLQRSVAITVDRRWVRPIGSGSNLTSWKQPQSGGLISAS